MKYLARFEEQGSVLFRFDTRIYLNSYDSENDSNCVGAIIGKNPGSAKPRELNELAEFDLNGDNMLPTVRRRFVDGYGLTKKQIPPNSFVRVWNLFYICDPNLISACQKATEYGQLPNCPTESEYSPIVWYAWGGGNKGRYQQQLNLYKERFVAMSSPQQFYYDTKNQHIVTSAPSIESFARHTQGMPREPVNEHLAKIL